MNKKLFKIFFSMSFFLIIGKGLGFVRVALVGSTYGAGFITDIYSFEDSLINEIYSVFSTFLACTFIPRYLMLDSRERNDLFNLLLNWGMIIISILMVLCCVFTRQLLQILVPGYFELYDIELVIFATRVNLIMLPLTLLVNYFLVVLQAHEKLIYLTLESVFLNSVVIVYLLLFSEYGILGLLSCRIITYSLFLCLLIYRLKKDTNLKYRYYVSISDRHLKEMIRLSLPMLCITVLWQINYVIDKSMASGLESGSVACLNYANTVSMIIYNIIGYVISAYAYPVLSRCQHDAGEVSRSFKMYTLILLQLVLPIAIMTGFFSEFISDFIYGHGNMAKSSVSVIAGILVMYIPGSVAYCMKNMYSKLFYIKKNTKLVLLLDIMGCLLNIILNILLIRPLGVYGLALATSTAYVGTVFAQIVIANKKRYTSIKLGDLWKCLVKICILLPVAYVFNEIVQSNDFGQLAALFIVGCGYILACLLFNFEGLQEYMKSILSTEKRWRL